jgi:hypothetical protein
MTTRFKVTARLAMKTYCYQFIRNERDVTAYLNSVKGVENWLTEQQPLVLLKIEDVIQDRDMTDMFESSVTFAASRYGNDDETGHY